MSLQIEIQDIQSQIKAGKFVNEASVSQGIILRLLKSLGWEIFDASCVSPQYSVGSGRVDYALCHPPNKPIILIEVKGIGLASGGEKQLFEYAFHQGIPMAILTDGQEWHFFLPGEQGDYQERCVYKLDIVARPVSESADIFQKYIDYSEIVSGKAIENAKNDYRNVSKKRQIKDALPTAWYQLLEDEDELLVELIAERAETICGFKPEPETVAKFIGSLVSSPPHVKTKDKPPIPINKPLSSKPISSTEADQIRIKKEFTGFILRGHKYQESNAIKVLMRVFEVLSSEDPDFLERYATLPKHGRRRRYLSRNKMELYPGRPDLCEQYSEMKFGGWWIGTNYSRSTIWNAIELACQVSKMEFGKDLRLI